MDNGALMTPSAPLMMNAPAFLNENGNPLDGSHLLLTDSTYTFSFLGTMDSPFSDARLKMTCDSGATVEPANGWTITQQTLMVYTLTTGSTNQTTVGMNCTFNIEGTYAPLFMYGSAAYGSVSSTSASAFAAAVFGTDATQLQVVTKPTAILTPSGGSNNPVLVAAAQSQSATSWVYYGGRTYEQPTVTPLSNMWVAGKVTHTGTHAHIHIHMLLLVCASESR